MVEELKRRPIKKHTSLKETIIYGGEGKTGGRPNVFKVLRRRYVENYSQLFSISTEVDRTGADGTGQSRRRKGEAVEMTKYKSGANTESMGQGEGASLNTSHELLSCRVEPVPSLQPAPHLLPRAPACS